MKYEVLQWCINGFFSRSKENSIYVIARKVKITSRGQILTSYFIALIEITIEIFSLNHLMWGEFQFTNSFFQNFTCNNKIFQISRKKQNDMVILVNDNISAPLNDTFHFIQTTCPTNTPEASLFYLFSLPPSPALNLLYIITMYFMFTSYICIHK